MSMKTIVAHTLADHAMGQLILNFPDARPTSLVTSAATLSVIYQNMLALLAKLTDPEFTAFIKELDSRG